MASSILLATVLFVSALARAVSESIEALRALGHEEALDRLIIASVRHADVLLIGTALLVIGLGLYSIFIERVTLLPRRLEIRGIEDLKERLASVVVVALAVDFFTVALEWNGSGDILAFGGAIGAVLLGLSAYVLVQRVHGGEHGTGAPHEDTEAHHDGTSQRHPEREPARDA